MASQVMRITLKAYDHQLVDQSAAKIIETVKKTGSQVSGPVPLPTKKEVVTILRAVHKYKAMTIVMKMPLKNCLKKFCLLCQSSKTKIRLCSF